MEDTAQIVTSHSGIHITEEDVMTLYVQEFTDKGVSILRRVVVCCGEDIICRDFTQTCRICEADYNMSGQKLAPRDQWGEETGEHWSECY